MTTRNIRGINASAAANAVVADSARARHQAVQNEMAALRERRDLDILNAAIAQRAREQQANDQLLELSHELGQTSYVVGQAPVTTGYHPLNIRRWSLLQWILAIVLAVLGLLLAWATFDVVADIFGNPLDGWRTVLKVVWASGWVLVGFGLGGLIGALSQPRRP